MKFRKLLKAQGAILLAAALAVAPTAVSAYAAEDDSASEVMEADETDVDMNAEDQEATESETEEIEEYEGEWKDRLLVDVSEGSYLYVRAVADEDGEELAKMRFGCGADILDRGEEWTLIESGDIIGWVSNEYCFMDEEAQAHQDIYNPELVAMTDEQYRAQFAELVSQDDIDLLAAIITCEAGGECYEGQVAVGAVVLNRMYSSAWPNTIRDVIYQSGQFSPAMSGWLNSVVNNGSAFASCYEAAYDALAGADPTGGCMYFHAGGGSGLTIGHQTFY